MGIEPKGRDKRVRANKFGKEKEEESKTSDLTKVNFLKWREVDEEQICFVLTFFWPVCGRNDRYLEGLLFGLILIGADVECSFALMN